LLTVNKEEKLQDEKNNPRIRLVGGTAFRSGTGVKDMEIERINVSVRNSQGQDIFRQEEISNWGFIDMYAKDVGDVPEPSGKEDEEDCSIPKIPITMFFVDKKQGDRVIRTAIIRGSENMLIIENVLIPGE
jgi:hypothetical protein